MTPPSTAQDSRHYQFLLVKRFDGARPVTYPPHAWPTAKRARDKTLDRFEAGSDPKALQLARAYSRRSIQNKGPLPGPFRGVVVARHETVQTKPQHVRMTRGRSLVVTNRRRRERDTTVWLYYVDTKGDAYSVDPTTKLTGDLVRPISRARP